VHHVDLDGLTIWDRLHGTLRLDVPQDAITIGVLAYRAPGQVRFMKLLFMPFLPGGRVA
jgi:hypothetical protein